MDITSVLCEPSCAHHEIVRALRDTSRPHRDMACVRAVGGLAHLEPARPHERIMSADEGTLPALFVTSRAEVEASRFPRAYARGRFMGADRVGK